MNRTIRTLALLILGAAGHAGATDPLANGIDGDVTTTSWNLTSL